MDVIESIKKDKAYLKCKLTVKNWEKDFKSKYSRTPSKFDIKEAPSNIKYAYKKYFQLKSAALENSLSICDIEENPPSPEAEQQLDSLACDVLSPLSDQFIPALPSGQELEKLLSKPVTQGNVKTLNTALSPFTDNLSKKLFQNRTFSLRNPRKWSWKSQTTVDSNTTVTQEDKIDFSKSLTEGNTTDCNGSFVYTVKDSKEKVKTCNLQHSISFTGNIVNQSTDTPKLREVSEAWLQRASGINNDNKTNNECSKDKYGLGNINISNIDKLNDYVENSESDDEDIALSKLKPALKKRKYDSQVIAMDYGDRHNNSIDQNKLLTNQNSSKVLKKNERKTKPMKVDKIESCSKEDQQLPDIAEYIPFGLDKEVVPRHSKVSNILQSVDLSKNASCVNKLNDTSNTEKLENKIKNGTLNDNFVKINIEKKVFVRGKKNNNYSKYKKQQWKDKKALHAGMEFPESGKLLCFKCGSSGHMARYCTSQKGDKLLPLDSYDEGQMPTLDDMQKIVSEETKSSSLPEQLTKCIYQATQIPDSFIKLLAETQERSNLDVEPIFSNNLQETPKLIYDVLQKFGHTSFRPGQEKTILRVLCGMSTLLILSTGGGKSLCYQLPAYIYSQHYKCITLVISPLVSLMEDQVLNMPEFLKAGCLHTNQTPTQRTKIVQLIKEGEINILLISPEALVASDTSNGFAGLFKSLPQIAFACIDEAHCVSQWSHNFRPSYLMICRVLREKLKVKCILGLTATASQTTIKSIVSHTSIPDGLAGVITNPSLPDNLCLSVSLEKDKDRALVSFLTSERIQLFSSIIVYCIRRDECERVAAVLRSCLKEPGKDHMEKQNNKRKRMSYIAEAYHAGMSAAQRKKIQKHFMDGTLRIIVATVAFGMGINKSDIRCIVHYNMPRNFESYVQEVGRAGRDGEIAYCHVFMNRSSNDQNELLKHIHANTIDRSTIRRLLEKVFIPCDCVASPENSAINESINTLRCKGHEVGIPIDNTVEELDLPSENIATLLCYIELHHKKYIRVLNNAYTICKISSYGGPQKILEAAKICPPLAMAYLVESKKDSNVVKTSVLEFNVIEVAAAIGWESGMTKYHLKNLEWCTENGSNRRSHLKVEFNTLGFRIKSPGDLSSAELDSILDDIHGTVLTQERAMLYQLEESNRVFSKLGNYSWESNQTFEDDFIQKSNELKSIIRDYFQRDNNIPENITLEERPLDAERVASDVRALICSYKDCNFTARSIARIFQGISSPNYPAIIWGRCKFWRSHIHEDFYGLIKVASQQIIQMKML